MDPKIYILIPTRNRYDTLKHSVQTCLCQEYDNLEVIVSDNFSTDGTPGIVNDFADKRLKYQRSDKSLPMLLSWEFALSSVKEPGYVHFMGDDNGITADAIPRIVDVIRRTGARIVHGSAIQYIWPNSRYPCGSLTVPKGNRELLVRSQTALEAAYKLRIGFDRMPTINSAFVHTSVIEKAKTFFSGKYFIASNPDVCSSIVNSYFEKEYVYLEKPFMVNGASGHSNGMSGSTGSKSAFVLDNVNGGYVYHPLFPPSKSYYLNVYEAFAQVSDAINKHEPFPKLSYATVFRKFFSLEYMGLKRYWLYEDIVDFAARLGIKTEIAKLAEENVMETTVGNNYLVSDNGASTVFESCFLPLKNVYEASQFATHFMANPAFLNPSFYKMGFLEKFKRLFIYRFVLRSREIQ